MNPVQSIPQVLEEQATKPQEQATSLHGQPFSLRDYLALPEASQPAELLDGVVCMSPSPDSGHQFVAGDLYFYLRSAVPSGRWLLAPMDVVLDEGQVLQPDLLWIAPERQTIIGPRIMGAPDLVVEILSPSTLKRDRGPKFSLYERYGVRELWLVNPAPPSIEVWVRGTAEGGSQAELLLHGVFIVGQTLKSPLLGHSFPVSPFFGL